MLKTKKIKLIMIVISLLLFICINNQINAAIKTNTKTISAQGCTFKVSYTTELIKSGSILTYNSKITKLQNITKRNGQYYCTITLKPQTSFLLESDKKKTSAKYNKNKKITNKTTVQKRQTEIINYTPTYSGKTKTKVKVSVSFSYGVSIYGLGLSVSASRVKTYNYESGIISFLDSENKVKSNTYHYRYVDYGLNSKFGDIYRLNRINNLSKATYNSYLKVEINKGYYIESGSSFKKGKAKKVKTQTLQNTIIYKK
ncbi:MAG: hypothetical protein LBR40_05340 [Bacilli bacterium]|jgi:hypothetical protein|nr:hypothetical protein [Bacilli bacterium]